MPHITRVIKGCR